MPNTPSENQAKQKATEARHVARFLELLEFKAEVIHQDRPYFVMVDGASRIGLEHQELTDEDLASTADNLTWLQGELGAELRRRGADRDLAVGVSVNAASGLYRRRRDLGELARRVAA